MKVLKTNFKVLKIDFRLLEPNFNVPILEKAKIRSVLFVLQVIPTLGAALNGPLRVLPP